GHWLPVVCLRIPGSRHDHHSAEAARIGCGMVLVRFQCGAADIRCSFCQSTHSSCRSVHHPLVFTCDGDCRWCCCPCGTAKKKPASSAGRAEKKDPRFTYFQFHDCLGKTEDCDRLCGANDQHGCAVRLPGLLANFFHNRCRIVS